MKPVINCLLNLRAEFITGDTFPMTNAITKSGTRLGDSSSHGSLSPVFGEERQRVSVESQFQRALRGPVMSGINDVMKSSTHRYKAVSMFTCLL